MPGHPLGSASTLAGHWNPVSPRGRPANENPRLAAHRGLQHGGACSGTLTERQSGALQGQLGAVSDRPVGAVHGGIGGLGLGGSCAEPQVHPQAIPPLPGEIATAARAHAPRPGVPGCSPLLSAPWVQSGRW